MTSRQKDWWDFCRFCLLIVLVFVGLAVWASSTRKRGPAGPLPPVPVVHHTSRLTITTNGANVVICGTNRMGQPFCVTNPPPPPVPRTMMTLAWTEPGYFTGSPFKLGFTNHLLWATNEAGPWTAIAVTCTNSNMFVNIPFNAKVKACFFKLGTNSF